MKTVRMLSAQVSALVLGFVLLAPSPAGAQHVRVFSGASYDFAVTAAPNEEVRVTILNPQPADPSAAGHGNVEFIWKIEVGEPADGVPGLTTVEPGEARTFALDPRACGQLLGGRTGLRRVVVSFDLRPELVDDVPQPPPAVTVEIVDLRTGETRTALLLPAVRQVRE